MMTKKERKQQAETHVKAMRNWFSSYIMASVRSSVIYGPSEAILDSIGTGDDHAPVPVTIEDQDVAAAVLEAKCTNRSARTAVLNFASYKEPGGRFLDGCMAQEEALCHASGLYNVLRQFGSYYEWNREHLNRALYWNRGIYSPDVPFVFEDKFFFCDVITVAAPNRRAAQTYCRVTAEENYEALYDRIRFVLDIAEHQQVDVLILGAYGCGVFGQDPNEVAGICKELLSSGRYSFQKAVFPIPVGEDGNLKAFRKTFGISADLSIYTEDRAELISQLINLFEDFLGKRRISLKGCGGFMEKSEACIGGDAAVTGADYDELRDGIDKILEHWNLF